MGISLSSVIDIADGIMDRLVRERMAELIDANHEARA